MFFRNPNRNLHRVLAVLLLLAALLITAGCNCDQELKKAQDMFNAAYQGQRPDSEATPQGQEKYRQTVKQVEEEVLTRPCRDDLKVQAYAIEAYSQLELGKYTEAINTANKGRDLYERTGKNTNPRDYGMLLIASGYATHAQAHDDYLALLRQKGSMTMAEARQFDRKMAGALKEIDSINGRLGKNEEIVIRANQEQLRVVWDLMEMWSRGIKDRKDWEPEVRHWLAQASEIEKKFPSGDYPFKARTRELLQKIDENRKALGPAKQSSRRFEERCYALL